MFVFLLSFFIVLFSFSSSFADCPRDSTIDHIFENYDFRVGDKINIDSQVWKVVGMKPVISLKSKEDQELICHYQEPDGVGNSKIVTLAPSGRIP